MSALDRDRDDEKVLWNDEKADAEIPVKKTHRYRALWFILLIVLSPCNFLIYQNYSNNVNYNDLANEFPLNGQTEQTPVEAFELQLPILYTNLVHEETILQHTFGNSWGVPAKNLFKTPTTKFNRVILVLNTTVDGVQYDRLAHIFIDGVPVWRTSTAEPGHQVVFSSSNRDITKYLPLFQSDEVEVTLKLDNLVRGKLTGAFETTLSVKYYNEEEQDEDQDEVASFFTVTSKPSQRVTKLVESNDNNSPVLYYPSDSASFYIPKVNANTTNLKLALYASGNAAEEFWYSNVLDKNRNIFDKYGHSLLGHGPVRVVNVYVDGIRISSVAPDPVIFTGGISPALWRPIVGVNAFDIKPLEIDLTAVLPKLWKKHSQLQIEITNGDSDKHIGQNWILAANLLHWESENIESSFGEVEDFQNTTYFGSFSISTDDDNLYQSVVSNHTVNLFTNLTYNLYNGTQVPLKLHTSTEARYSNYQQYSDFGDIEFVSTVVASSHSAKVYHEGSKVGDLKINKVYPLVISIDTEPIESRNVTYNANVTSVYGSSILIDGKEVYALESRYNGTSTFTLSPNGNFGFGSSYTNLAANLDHPFPKLRIDELAEAINGTVVKRESADAADAAQAAQVEIIDLSNSEVNQNHKNLLDLMVRENTISQELANKFLSVDVNAMSNFNSTTAARKEYITANNGLKRSGFNAFSNGILQG